MRKLQWTVNPGNKNKKKQELRSELKMRSDVCFLAGMHSSRGCFLSRTRENDAGRFLRRMDLEMASAAVDPS